MSGHRRLYECRGGSRNSVKGGGGGGGGGSGPEFFEGGGGLGSGPLEFSYTDKQKTTKTNSEGGV